MKKTLTILAILIATTLFAQTTYVPDDNFEQALIDLGYDSGPLDDYVPTANISGLTSLNVGNKNISDLTGIEDFTALTSLTFSYNSIQSVDISNNTALTELYCLSNQLLSLDLSNNTLLTTVKCHYNQLTTLDVSANTVLEILWCQHNTSLSNLNVSGTFALTHLSCSDTALTNIDVSNNTNLIELKCGNSQIVSLDVSNNTALTLLWCQSSQLTDLNLKNGNNTNVTDTDFDATNNPSLTCIQVDNATWSTANWTNIDATASFSENCIGGVPMTYVPDDNFEQALIDLGYDSGTLDNYVPTANISGVTTLSVTSKNIADLTGIQGFTDLTSLHCNINQLTSLDLSNNIALTELFCQGNQLTSLNISNNTALTELGCFSNQLTNLDLSSNIALENLYCYSNPLSGLDISNNTALIKLYCDNNGLTLLDVTQNTALTELACYSNQLTSLDISQNTALIKFRCDYNQLTTLNIQNGNNINITNNDFFAYHNPNLTCIEVDDAAWSAANWTNIDATASFSESCIGGVPMTYVPDDNFEQALIDLGYDSGTLDDYVPTANISGVTLLDINSKNIADLTGIEGFSTLTELYCISNQLTGLDLTQNASLEKLNCASNLLTSVSFNANVSLTHLNIANNQFTNLDVSSYTFLLLLSTSNNQLTNLDVSNNTALVFLMCNGNQLTELNVKNGNNTNVANVNFNATNNPNLTCIIVDDAVWSTANWNYIDTTSTFVNNQAECDALSVADNTFETQLSLYPNPAKNSFTVQNNSSYTIDNLSIYSLLGKLVLKTSNINAPINVSNLKNGVYLVKITSDSKTAIQKIIINN